MSSTFLRSRIDYTPGRESRLRNLTIAEYQAEKLAHA
jgi:hypothetical protein